MTLSLAEEINAATKPHHTALNQLLLRVLPLALPPHASDPRFYAYGISHFLPIYSAFESAIDSLLHSHRSVNPLLCRLHISGLERSPRLQRDLIRLLPLSYLQTLNSSDTCRSKVDTHSKEDGPSMLSNELTTFVTHIHESIRAKPHLYVSYTWVLYMAIFSGGRYIRAKLNSPGEDFWDNALPLESGKNKYGRGAAEVEGPENWPLSFWNFSGSSDGEDLKADYKFHVGELERILTLEEREEIIGEAAEIMKRLLEIVREIEVAVAEGAAEGIAGSESCKSLAADIDLMPSHKDDAFLPLSTISATRNPSLSTLLCKHLLPMGMVDLLAGIKNAFFSAGRSSKVSVAAPVKSDRT